MRNIRKLMPVAILCILAAFAVISIGCSGPRHDPKNIPDRTVWEKDIKWFTAIVDSSQEDGGVLFSITSNYDTNNSFIVAWGSYPNDRFWDEVVIIGENGELIFDDTWKPHQSYVRFMAWSPRDNVIGNTLPIYFYKLDGGKWVYVMTNIMTPDSHDKPIVDPDSDFFNLLTELVEQSSGAAEDTQLLVPRWVLGETETEHSP